MYMVPVPLMFMGMFMHVHACSCMLNSGCPFLRMSPRIKYPSFLFSRSTFTSPKLICITTAHLKALLRQALDQSLNTDL